MTLESAEAKFKVWLSSHPGNPSDDLVMVLRAAFFAGTLSTLNVGNSENEVAECAPRAESLESYMSGVIVGMSVAPDKHQAVVRYIGGCVDEDKRAEVLRVLGPDVMVH